jgi:ketosteroid isomerase-like protein
MTTQPIGDLLPAALAAYYTDLDGGRLHEAAQHFADDVLYAVPRPDEIETSPRVEYEGRDAVQARFIDRGMQPVVHDVQLCVVEGSACLLEGVTRDAAGHAFATFVASAQLDSAGLVSRYLAYRCLPAVDPEPPGAGPSPGDADKVLHAYFDALDAGEFEEAADCFSTDVVYSHPPYRHTGLDSDNRVVFRGRDALVAAFRVRGRQSFDHRILESVQRGPHCMLEGLVEGLPGGRSGSFISSLSLDGDGRIQRYVSFYCEPSVARRTLK